MNDLMGNGAVTNLTAKRDISGRFVKGNKPKNGFDRRPQDRHSGSWKKENTPRFMLEQMMQKTKRELEKIVADDCAPMFCRAMANIILDDTGSTYKQWKVIEGMINQVYGKPTQVIVAVESYNKRPFITGFLCQGVRKHTYENNHADLDVPPFK